MQELHGVLLIALLYFSDSIATVTPMGTLAAGLVRTTRISRLRVEHTRYAIADRGA